MSYDNETTGTGFSTTFQRALAGTVGVTCAMSILGSGMIILSFVLFRELRTTLRYVLLHLSIADLMVAATNLFGAFYTLHFPNTGEKIHDNDTLCVAQATLGLFSTDASILLTILFISYVFTLVTCYRPIQAKRIPIKVVVNLLTFFSWIFPFVLATVFAGEKYFGYRHEYSPRFCTIYVSKDYTEQEIFRQIVGYEMFLYISFLVLPVLSVAFTCHLCYMQKRNKSFIYNIEKLSVLQSAELKLIFVPILFMVIRVWGLILDIGIFYCPNDHIPNSKTLLPILVFLTGVGNSAQGFLNGLFFVLLTPSVRSRLNYSFIKHCCTKHRSYEQITTTYKSSSVNSQLEESTGKDTIQESKNLIPKPKKKYSVIMGRDVN